jgi:YD repeat-containing protein
MGNLVEEKSLSLLPDGSTAERTLRHEYDLMGNRVRSILPGGEIAEFLPCSSGYTHQISFAARPNSPERVISAFERDELNHETLRTQGRLHSRRGYDPLSRLIFMRTDGFADEGSLRDMGVPVETIPLVGKKFGYDAGGELIRSEDLFSGEMHYKYDLLGRILAASRPETLHADRLRRSVAGLGPAERSSVEHLFTEERFLYDRAGNLFSTGAGSDSRLHEALPEQRLAARRAGELPVAHNRLDAIDDIPSRYDPRGRVVEKRCLESERRWAYRYDSDSRLLEVEQNAPSGFKRIRFSYDAFRRRTGRYDGRSQTLFIWDGLRLLREETGQNATTYFYEQGGHVPLARVDGHNAFAEVEASLPDPESVYYYHCNVAGLPEDITDSEGRIV